MTRSLPSAFGAATMVALLAASGPASANPPMGGARMGPPAMGGAMGAWRGPVGPRVVHPVGPRGGAWGWARPGAGWRAGEPYGWQNGYGCRGGWGCAGWANGAWGWGGSAVVVGGVPAGGATMVPPDPGPPSLPIGGVLPSPIGAPVLYRIDDRSKPGARGPGGARIISIGKPEPMPGVAASTYSHGVGRPVMYTLTAE
ncbi:MAG: hypothetical protein U1E62_09635 [Alsobacter sp.]